MRRKVSKMLRKISLKEGLNYKMVKKAYLNGEVTIKRVATGKGR